MTIQVVATSVVTPQTPPRVVDLQCFAASDHAHPFAVVDPNLLMHAALPRGLGRKIDRFSALAIVAVRELIAALPESQPRNEIGIFVGNALGGWSYSETQLENLVRVGPRAVHPHQATAWFPAAAQGEVTIRFGLSGFSKTTSGGKLCGCEALVLAIDALQKNEVKYAIAGAVESPYSSWALWSIEGRCPPPTYLYGEGAAFLLLTNAVDEAGPLLDVAIIGENDPTSQADTPREVRIPGVDLVIDVIAAAQQRGQCTTIRGRCPGGQGFAVTVDCSPLGFVVT